MQTGAASTVELLPEVTLVLLFLAAAGLAAFAAVAELIGRFRDEPLRVVGSRQGILYLALNAALAAVVLAAILYASPPNTGLVALEQVLLAGFGARILIRTKVVGVRGKEGEEIGPGTVFERLLSSISRTADRDRAAARLTLVTKQLEGVLWELAHPFFFPEIAGAMQDLTDDEKTTIQANLDVIKAETGLADSTRVDLLGYLILDYAGEEFLKKVAEIYRKRYSDTAPLAPPSSTGAGGSPTAPTAIEEPRDSSSLPVSPPTPTPGASVPGE